MAVSVSRKRGRADYVLGGKLRQVEEYDHDDRWEAHLSLDIYVIANETRDVVYTLRFDESEPAGAPPGRDHGGNEHAG